MCCSNSCATLACHKSGGRTGSVPAKPAPAGRTFQLLRLRIDPSCGLIPEISGNRLIVSVRLMKQEADGRLHACTDDAAFELTLCA